MNKNVAPCSPASTFVPTSRGKSGPRQLLKQRQIGGVGLAGDLGTGGDTGFEHRESLSEITSTRGEVRCFCVGPPRDGVRQSPLLSPPFPVRIRVPFDVDHVTEFVGEDAMDRGGGVVLADEYLDAALSGIGECTKTLSRSQDCLL